MSNIRAIRMQDEAYNYMINGRFWPETMKSIQALAALYKENFLDQGVFELDVSADKFSEALVA